MEPKFNLIIDSCCDLPPQMLKLDGVRLIRFPYLLSDGNHEDDMFEHVNPHDFYEPIRKKKEFPSTAQVPIPVFLEAYDWAYRSGKPTVYLSFTAALSGSFNTACLLRDQVVAEHPDMELHVVDTYLASIAEGFLVYEALRQREKGLTAQELVDWVSEAVYYVDAMFMVEDLDSLARGGRLPGVGAYLGSKLDVKPLVTFDLDGHLTMCGLARGRKKGVKTLIEHFGKRPEESRISGETVFIGHADCKKDAERLREGIEKDNPEALVLECNIGPVIGSHVGPGMIAVVCWGSDRRKGLSVADRIARRVKGQ